MNNKISKVMAFAAVAFLGTMQAQAQADPASPSAAPAANGAEKLVLKRKVAIGRFSNATNYGRALLGPEDRDPLADQAADILANQLVSSGKFLVLERSDIQEVRSEAGLTGQRQHLIGADALLIGSVTKFGRQTEGKVGFLSSTKRQTASATVEIRLVDVKTGIAFFSTSGTGTADTESSEVAGFGSRAAYDSTLDDKAIGAAIADLMTNIMQKLQERPWFTDILDVQGNNVLISGGPAQGLKVGDEFTVQKPGASIISQQTGLPIVLPPTPVARIRVGSFFGTGDAEGASAVIISGAVSASEKSALIVTAGD